MTIHDHDDAPKIELVALPPRESRGVHETTHSVSIGRNPSPRHLRLLATVACSLVVLGALAVVVKRVEPAGDAAARLAAAQEAVASARSFSYELRYTSTVQVGDPDGAGSDTTSRSVATGTVAAPDRWHTVEDSGDPFLGDLGEPYEVVRIGSDVFEKGGYDDAPDGVDAPAWLKAPVGDPLTIDDYAEMYSFVADDQLLEDFGEYAEEDEALTAEWRLDVILGAYLLPVGADPANLRRLVEEATDPVVEERLPDGGTRLRTQLLPIPELVEAGGEDLEAVDLVLDLGDADLPTSARFSVAAEGVSAVVEIAFSDWNDELVVEAPPADDVDTTPWIMEEALGAVDEDILVAPTELPEGMSLTGADVYEWDEGCFEVNLTFSHEDELALTPDLSPDEYAELWESIPYLSITVLTRSCSDDLDDSSFDDTFGGLPSRGEDGYIEVVVGGAVVTIDTDMADEDVELVARSLRATTPAQLADTIPEWARQWAIDGWSSLDG